MADPTALRCAICASDQPDVSEFEGRPLCALHIQSFFNDFPALWSASTTSLGVVLVLVLVLTATNQLGLTLKADSIQLAVNIIVVYLPAITWFGLLMRGATSPEESRLVVSSIAVFLVSGLISAAIVQPVLQQIVGLDLWLASLSPLSRFLGNVLVGSTIHSFTVYSVIRYSVWQTPMFERRVDGILFGIAAAMGYSTTRTLVFVLDVSGVTLLTGSLRILSQLFAFLAMGTVIGYFLGRNRFENLPFYYLLMGYSISVAINGVLLYAVAELNNTRLTFDSDAYSPWPGFSVGLIALSAVFAAVFGLVRRHNHLARGRLQNIQAIDTAGRG